MRTQVTLSSGGYKDATNAGEAFALAEPLAHAGCASTAPAAVIGPDR